MTSHAYPETTYDETVYTPANRVHQIKRAAEKVAKARAALDAAESFRDHLLVLHHGPESDGKLNHRQLAEAAGISRSRVTQVIQPVTKAARQSAR